MNETIQVLQEHGLPHEIAEKIYWMSARGQFRANYILPFEDISEFAMGVRINPLSYLDGKGIDIFQGMSHNTFIGFVFSKQRGYVTAAWGGIYEDVESDESSDDGYERVELTDEQRREIGISLTARWIQIARDEI